MAYKIIDINRQENVNLTLFSDNQVHVTVLNIKEGDDVDVICSITDSNKAIQLMQVSEALSNIGAHKINLIIPYLAGARYDRHMVSGDSFDLMVFASMINWCGFTFVRLFDVHSQVALELIRNSMNIIPNLLIDYDKEDVIYICPDKGAKSRVPLDAKEVIYCEKERSTNNDKVTVKMKAEDVLKCGGRNCVIVDDICDGGRTFIEIASQITPKHLTLAVTHGIFSRGVIELKRYFDLIITSNSLPQNSKSVKVVEIY